MRPISSAASFAATMLVGFMSHAAPAELQAKPTKTLGAENTGFTDVTKASGMSEAIARHYERFSKWWISESE
jgi:hypothetical protein